MEPCYPGAAPEPKLMLLDFLEARRQSVLGLVAAMPYETMTRTVLPSGWTPLGMLAHLVFMERRWLVWGSPVRSSASRRPTATRAASSRCRAGMGYLELSALHAIATRKPESVVNGWSSQVDRARASVRPAVARSAKKSSKA